MDTENGWALEKRPFSPSNPAILSQEKSAQFQGCILYEPQRWAVSCSDYQVWTTRILIYPKEWENSSTPKIWNSYSYCKWTFILATLALFKKHEPFFTLVLPVASFLESVHFSSTCISSKSLEAFNELPSQLLSVEKKTCNSVEVGSLCHLSNKVVYSPGGARFLPSIFIFWVTLPKFNMEPENDGFQEELPFLGTSFQVPC